MSMKLSDNVDSLALQAIRIWILEIEREKKRLTGDTLTAKEVASEIATVLTERGVTIAAAVWNETPKPANLPEDNEQP